MKLKMNQSVYIDFMNRVVSKDEEIEFSNEKQARDFLKVNYAELVVEEAPKQVKKVEEKVEKPAATKPAKPKGKQKTKASE